VSEVLAAIVTAEEMDGTLEVQWSPRRLARWPYRMLDRQTRPVTESTRARRQHAETHLGSSKRHYSLEKRRQRDENANGDVPEAQ